MSQSWVEKAILYQGECHEICNLILVVIYELRLIRNAKVLGQQCWLQPYHLWENSSVNAVSTHWCVWCTAKRMVDLGRRAMACLLWTSDLYASSPSMSSNERGIVPRFTLPTSRSSVWSGRTTHSSRLVRPSFRIRQERSKVVGRIVIRIFVVGEKHRLVVPD